MNEIKNLKTISEELGEDLSSALDLLNILYEYVDGDRKTDPMLKIIREKVRLSLNNVEVLSDLVAD